MENRKPFWHPPWRYKQAAACVGGIVAVGFVLQLSAGPFDFSLLRWPVNGIAGGATILALLLFALRRRTPFYRWFSGVPVAVTLICTLVVLGVVMGLTPQTGPGESLPARLGLTRMTSSWPFVLVYFAILLSLGALILRRLFSFRLRDYAFYLNHLGLWLLLFAAGMGAADIKRYVMHVREGEVEWRVYNARDEVLDLPVAIRLNDFRMEEYPPLLTVIDRETGAQQPEGKPEFFHIDEKQPIGHIARWEITLKEYIHQAVRGSDSTYREVHMPGASPAARVEVRGPKETLEEGWVCAGNISQLYMVLNLDERHCLAMTRPEPKRFVSDIDVYTEDGRQAHALLEVNKPFKLGHWMLYQYGYDNDAGNLSTYSSIELVYDPWVVPVYIGIILLAAGSVCMLWGGNKRKEADDDLE